MTKTLQQLLEARYADAPTSVPEAQMLDVALKRGSCRAFATKDVPRALLHVLCAAALASPSKSDLQQRDIILLTDPDQRAKLAALVPDQEWVAAAPMLAVFCGNNRRQRLAHEWHKIQFANDHLDAVFNATADAAIALGAFVAAAEAMGLGCCPISAVRNQSDAVSDLLGLPDHVFPFAGLGIGYPARPPRISMRLPLSVTCHENQYSEAGLQEAVSDYDAARSAAQPYTAQRFPDAFADTDDYGWSQDKARQYSRPERAGFGAFLKRKGFRLE